MLKNLRMQNLLKHQNLREHVVMKDTKLFPMISGKGQVPTSTLNVRASLGGPGLLGINALKGTEARVESHSKTPKQP